MLPFQDHSALEGHTFIRRVPVDLLPAWRLLNAAWSKGAPAPLEVRPAGLELALLGLWDRLDDHYRANSAAAHLLHDIATLADMYAELEAANLVRIKFTCGRAWQPLEPKHSGLRIVYTASASEEWQFEEADERTPTFLNAIILDFSVLQIAYFDLKDLRKFSRRKLENLAYFKRYFNWQSKPLLRPHQHKQKPRADDSVVLITENDGIGSPPPKLSMLSPLISHPAATAETRLSRWMHRLIDESAVELKLVLIWIWQHLPVFMTESLLFMFSHGMTDPTILRRDLGKTIPDENLSAVEILPGKMTHRAALEYPGLSQAKIDVTQLVLSLSPAPLRKLNHHASPWLYSRLKAPAISETYSLNISPHHQCHHSVEPSPYPHPGE